MAQRPSLAPPVHTRSRRKDGSQRHTQIYAPHYSLYIVRSICTTSPEAQSNSQYDTHGPACHAVRGRPRTESAPRHSQPTYVTRASRQHVRRTQTNKLLHLDGRRVRRHLRERRFALLLATKCFCFSWRLSGPVTHTMRCGGGVLHVTVVEHVLRSKMTYALDYMHSEKRVYWHGHGCAA